MNNPILSEIDAILSLKLGDKQKKFYQTLKESAEKHKVSEIGELPVDIWVLLNRLFVVTPMQMKECYRNVAKLIMNNRLYGIFDEEKYSLYYIEGKTTVYGIPIEHAWLEIAHDGKSYYFDPTVQIVLKNQPNKHYVKFIRLDTDKVLEILLKHKVYGAWYPYIIEQKSR